MNRLENTVAIKTIVLLKYAFQFLKRFSFYLKRFQFFCLIVREWHLTWFQSGWWLRAITVPPPSWQKTCHLAAGHWDLPRMAERNCRIVRQTQFCIWPIKGQSFGSNSAIVFTLVHRQRINASCTVDLLDIYTH